VKAAKRTAKKPAAKRVAAKPAKPRKTPPKSKARNPAKPKPLSGGNPQIAKGYGDAPVRAYIDAMPGWKRDVGRRLDALITRTVPGVRKAVKWNSPLYGVEDGVWFLGLHCVTKYVKVAFFRGASLRPVPPGTSKQKRMRYFDIHEDDQLDRARFAAWVKQAARCPAKKCERGARPRPDDCEFRVAIGGDRSDRKYRAQLQRSGPHARGRANAASCD
jgi:hypothetical protein